MTSCFHAVGKYRYRLGVCDVANYSSSLVRQVAPVAKSAIVGCFVGPRVSTEKNYFVLDGGLDPHTGREASPAQK